MTQTRRVMGPVQISCLRALWDHEGWNPKKPGWKWETPSRTAKILDSLVSRGFVARDEETGIYTITEDGKKVLILITGRTVR